MREIEFCFHFSMQFWQQRGRWHLGDFCHFFIPRWKTDFDPPPIIEISCIRLRRTPSIPDPARPICHANPNYKKQEFKVVIIIYLPNRFPDKGFKINLVGKTLSLYFFSKANLAGLLKLGFFSPLCQNRGFVDLSANKGFGGIFSRKMAWNSDKCDLGLKLEAGVVLPATETCAEEAIGAIKSGKVIAVPTDTLYGFACDACSKEAVDRIYEIKGRKQTSPLAICVADVSDIERFAVTDNLPGGLLDSLLPGPVTVVLRRGDCSILEKSLNLGLDSIGVRVPDSSFIRIIARGSGSALALTSANLSGQPSSINIKDFENLWQHCAYVYDGGLLPSGRAGSTVIDLTKPGLYKILRPGSAMEETIAVLERFFLKKAP